MFGIVIGIVLLLFTGIGVILLVRPSLYMRWNSNPWLKGTPWNRVQMRVVGLVVCLFLLLVASGILSGPSKSKLLASFSDNILVTLWVAFISAWFGGLVSWILWRFASFRTLIHERYSPDKIEGAAWERKMTIWFCSLLFVIVAVTFFLAAKGLPPQ